MKLVDLFNKIEMGKDDFPPTIYWDFIEGIKYLDYEIVLKGNGRKVGITPDCIMVDDKNQQIIFNIAISKIN